MNNEQEILTLTDREKCRLRTPVFMGSFDCRMINLNEVLMNARDEINTNFESGEIHIKLHEDMKTVTIRDTGRGIPIRGVDSSGTKKSDLIFKTLFSGCNFQNINKTNGGTFIENCGQNGAGLTTTQYISTFFQGTQILNHEAYEVTYHNGGLEEEDRTYESEYEHGTIITYSLDPTVVTNIYYTYEEVLDTIRRVASTTKDKIKYTFAHKDQVNIFQYETFEDYFEENFTSISPILHFNEKSSMFESTRDGQKFKEGNRLEVLLSLSTTPTQETYLNGGFLPEQGTFYKGIVDGLKKFFQKDVKGKTKLTDNDIVMSFNIYAVMGSNNPVYSNQTKKASSNEIYKKIASNYIVENMEVVKIEQPKVFDQMLKHLTMINSFNTKNEESIKNIKKKLTEKVDGIGNRVEGLVDCRVHGEEAELFICEGQSALSTCVLSRDAYNQAIMAVRGKILSTLKVGYDKIFANQLITDIIKVLGCGVQVGIKGKKDMGSFNIENLRFHKIILTADQDADGATICCLLLTMLWRLVPYLIENGYVYMAKTPLYEITYEDGSLHYAFTDKEKEQLLSGHNPSKCKIQRNKGLGELEAETMARTTMNPQTRVIERVVVEDIDKMAENFEKWFGTDVSNRKQHIEENLHKYVKDLD